MNRPDVWDSIYLNKRSHEQATQHWAYYRVTSLGGNLGDHVHCLVAWPSLSDIDVVGEEDKAPVVNPADTGFISAYPNLCNLLNKKWNIDHEQSILIGMRVRGSSN